MRFLLQKNIWNEYGYSRLYNSIIDHGHILEEVHVIPLK